MRSHRQALFALSMFDDAEIAIAVWADGRHRQGGRGS